MTSTLHHGSCPEALRLHVPDASVDSCVTDPPYELGFMGKKWDASGIAFSVPYWAEVLRCMKPGAHLVAFSGTRTYHRMVCAIEDAGFEVRDQLAWVFGSGFPKSHNLEGPWEGWGTALKPAWEPIVLARRPLLGTVAENVDRHGTGALHVDACRVEGAKGSGVWGSSNAAVNPERTFVGSPEAAEFRSEQDPAGRWPANLCHDGSDEVLAQFPKEAGAFAPVKSGHDGTSNGIYSDFASKGDDGATFRGDSGSAARFFYCAKASKSDRETGLELHRLGALAQGNQAQAEVKRGNNEHGGDSGFNTVKMRANIHPTVKPTDLMRWLCRLVTPPGGTVLDPMMGSGSTGRGAILEGFHFIGIEREDQYLDIARSRIQDALREVNTVQLTLF